MSVSLARDARYWPQADIQLVPNGLFLVDRAGIVIRDAIFISFASHLREGPNGPAR